MMGEKGGSGIGSRLSTESGWFSTFFHHSPIAMWVTRLDDGTIVEVNGPFCALSGWTREELIGRTAEDLGFYTSPDERQRVRDRLEEHGELRDVEHPYVTRQGERREALRYSQTLGFGGETFVLSQIVDITDRKRTEASLERSQRTLDTIFDNARQTFALLDRQRRVIAFNRMADDHARQLVGRGLVVGEPFDNFVAPEGHASILANIDDALEGHPTVAQRELTGLDGEVRCYEGHYDPVWGDDGEVRGVFLSVLDVTDRKSMEEALRESEIKLRAIFDSSLQSFTLIDRNYHIKMYNQVANERSKRILGQAIREGDPIERYVRDELQDAFFANLRRAFAGESVSDELQVTDTQGERVWFQAHYSPARDASGQVIGVFNSLTDITDRKLTEQHMDRRLRELTTVHEVSQRLQALQSLEELANALIGILEASLHYEYCGVFLVDAEDRLVPFALGDWQHRSRLSPAYRATVEDLYLHLGRGIVGWVAQHGESIRCGDVGQEPRYDPILPDIQSELCVPLMNEGTVLGVINVETRQPHAYSEWDQRVLEIIASQVAVAIQNAQLFQQAERARDRVTSLSQQLMQAQEAERRAIANELHDEVGQTLTAVKLLLEANGTDVSHAEADGPVKQASGLIDDLIDQVRRLSLDLRPAMLDDLGLWPTLKWHVERFQTHTGVQVDLAEDGLDGASLPSEVETTAYRIVQEALTNVARHAQTDRVQARLCLDESELHIDIRDRGVGFPAKQLTNDRTSTGLTGMRERAELLGGSLQIRSSRGAGTQVTCTLPRADPSAQRPDRPDGGA